MKNWKMRTSILLAAICFGPCLAYAQVDGSRLERGGPPPQGPLGTPDCTGFPDYQQPLDASTMVAYASDAEGDFEAAEATVNAGGMIIPIPDNFVVGVRFWGISLEFNLVQGFNAECTADDLTPFNFTLYPDVAGLPDFNNPIDTSVALPTIVDTGIPFVFATIKEYSASLMPPLNTGGTAAWLSIQRQQGNNAPDGDSCVFLWNDEENAATYDDLACQIGVMMATCPIPADLTMCLDLDAVPVELESFGAE